jgi:hypothetical protein
MLQNPGTRLVLILHNNPPLVAVRTLFCPSPETHLVLVAGIFPSQESTVFMLSKFSSAWPSSSVLIYTLPPLTGVANLFTEMSFKR